MESGAHSSTYPEEWRAVVRQVRVLVMDSDDPPTQADWERAETLPPDREHRARDRADELATEHYNFGRVVWVYAGHNGPYAPGVWKWWLCIGPPGWVSPRDLELRALERQREAEERAKREREAAAKKERDRLRREGKLADRFTPTDAIVSGTVGKVTQRTIDAVPVEGWERYEDSEAPPF